MIRICRQLHHKALWGIMFLFGSVRQSYWTRKPQNNIFHGRPQNNIFHGRPQSNLFHGRPQNNIFHGRPQNNIFQGRPQNNLLHGRPQNIIVEGPRTIMLTGLYIEYLVRYYYYYYYSFPHRNQCQNTTFRVQYRRDLFYKNGTFCGFAETFLSNSCLFFEKPLEFKSLSNVNVAVLDVAFLRL